MKKKTATRAIWFLFGLLSLLAVMPASAQVVEADVKINGMI